MMEFSELIAKRQSIRRYKTGDVPDDVLLEIINAARVAPSGKNMQNWHFVVIKRRSLIEKIADAILQRNEEVARGMEARGVGAQTNQTDDPQGAGVAQTNQTDGRQGAGVALPPDRFRKFVRNFTLFFTGAPVLIVVMAQTYLPSGYRELEAAGADADTLKRLAYLASPGMQSLGAAIEHLVLKTVELGYGSCCLTSANYASDLIEDIVVNETDFPYGLLRDIKIRDDEPVIGGNAPGFEHGWFMAELISIGIPEEGAKSPGRKPIEAIMTFVK